jgi:hypothetical protein
MGAELVRVRSSVAAPLLALIVVATGIVTGCGTSNHTSADCRAAVPAPVATADLRDGPPPVPATGAYLGAFALDGTTFSQSAYLASTARLEAAICRPLDIVHSYLQWQAPFPAESVQAASRDGQAILLSWTGTDLAQMASGQDDAAIRTVADEVAALRTPVFLEFRWEMERPNLAGVVHSPATFIAAWDHTRAVFAGQGVTNASWVWCPTATGFDNGSAQAYYPGASQVDWICTDAYPTPGTAVESLQTELSPFLSWADRQGRPIMLGEIGVPENYPDKTRAQWFDHASSFIRATPQIKAVVYFDYNPVGHTAERDYVLPAGSQALQAFARLAADPWFAPRLAPSPRPSP